MNMWKLLVCVAVLIFSFAPLTLAQVPIRPDLVELPPPPPLPDGPAGTKAPVAVGAPPAPAKPGPKNPGEAQVYGSVTDETGAVLPGATVTIRDASGAAHNATSNGQGQYYLNLQPGTYSLSIGTKGFKEFRTEGLTLAADQELEMDGSLEPASAAAEKVEVVGNSVGQVETESPAVSGTITAKEIVNTPLNGRNFTQLLTLAPGVSNQSQQDEALVGVKGSVKFSVNGGRVEYNTFSVDGSDVLHAGIHGSESTLVVYPSLDAINELKVLTSNYGAQYGRSASGTILVDTKTGGSTLHGGAYYFGRNEIFNSRNYFDQTIRAPLYRKNDFGFTLGGPVLIPKLYPKKDRTFFFYSEEFRIEKDPTDNNFNQAVPSLAQRPSQRINADGNPYIGADFSDVCPLIPPGVDRVAFNPAQFPDCPRVPGGGNTTFPFNIVGYSDSTHPAAQYPQIDPVGTALVSSGMIPLPNASVGCNSTIGSCYDFAFAQPTYWRQELFRIDHDITPGKLRATFRYIHDSWDTTEPRPIWGYVRNSFPTVQGRLFGPGTSSVARLTHTISPSLLNEIVVSYTASHISLSTRPAAGVDISRPDGLDQGYLFNNGFGGKLSGIQLAPGNLAYGGGFRMDPGYAPWQLTNPTYSFRDDLNKIVGRHNLQMGVQVIFGQRNEINATNGPNTGDLQGVLTFSNFNSATVGNEFANLLLGDIQSYQQDSAQQKYYNSYDIIEPYFQDDWKINSHLTVNMGIRFSLFGNYHERNHQAWNWDPAAFVDPSDTLTFFKDGRLRLKGNHPIPIDLDNLNPIITNGLVQCGVNGVPDTCQPSHRFNPTPRIGFAWDPRGDGKFSIRGGYGVFFEHGTGSEANTGSLVGSAPVNLTMTQLIPSANGSGGDISGYPCIGGIGGKDANCFSGVGAYPIDVTSIPRKAIWPYVQQWSFGIQREVSRGVILGLGYVGSKGTHLTAVRQPNAFPLSPQGVNDGIQLDQNPYRLHQPIIQNSALLGATDCSPVGGTFNNPVFRIGGQDGILVNNKQPAYINLLAACENFSASSLPPINSRRPYLGIQRIFSLENVADSNYHAFQATLRRTRGPLTVDVSYSYSHSIDDSSDRNDTSIVNPLEVSANKANSNFDQRHLINVSYVWTLPKFRFDSSRVGDWANDREPSEEPSSPGFFDHFVEGVFGGWQIAGVTTLQSGIPYSVINAGYGALGISVPDNAGVAGGISSIGSFPDIVGNIHGATPAGAVNSRSFGPALGNAAAFAAPRGLTFGNAGRNAMNNPSRLNFDMTLFRTIKVHESTSMEFRAEVFNVFNHTQFRVYDPSPNFGNGATNTIACYGIDPNNPAGAFNAAGDAQTDCLTGNAFLHPVNAHRPRTVQFGLKLSF